MAGDASVGRLVFAGSRLWNLHRPLLDSLSFAHGAVALTMTRANPDSIVCRRSSHQSIARLIRLRSRLHPPPGSGSFASRIWRVENCLRQERPTAPINRCLQTRLLRRGEAIELRRGVNGVGVNKLPSAVGGCGRIGEDRLPAFGRSQICGGPYSGGGIGQAHKI